MTGVYQYTREAHTDIRYVIEQKKYLCTLTAKHVGNKLITMPNNCSRMSIG